MLGNVFQVVTGSDTFVDASHLLHIGEPTAELLALLRVTEEHLPSFSQNLRSLFRCQCPLVIYIDTGLGQNRVFIHDPLEVCKHHV